jgi:hypothetical protein
MALVIAAIRTGHDPVGRLPEAAFHRQLDLQLTCPKCEATYNLVVDFDRSVGRFFEDESRRPIMMLRKAIMLGHGDGHRVAHFESAGVVVTSFGGARAEVKANADSSAPLQQDRRKFVK